MKTLLCLVLLGTQISVFAASKTVDTINVLTLNTWMVPGQRKMAAARAQAIGKAIAKYDLVTLQETFTSGMRATIMTYAKLNGAQFDNRYQRRHPLFLNSGKVVFSSNQITKTDFKRFLNCRGFQCFSRKGILYTQIQLPSGQLVDVFTTHLQAFEKDYLIRKWQLERLSSFVAEKNDGSLPIIFTGDFNVIGETSEYQELMQTMNGFTDVYRDFHPHDPGMTYNPEENFWASLNPEGKVEPARLDYIFIRDGKNAHWQIKNAKIALKKAVDWTDPHRTQRKILASDHYGVAATLMLEQK